MNASAHFEMTASGESAGVHGSAAGMAGSGGRAIPIANIYYLLCYAWDALAEAETLVAEAMGEVAPPGPSPRRPEPRRVPADRRQGRLSLR